MTQQRFHWMDLLRGVAVILVVLWHVPSIPLTLGGADTPRWATQVLSALAPYRIPMLLFLSGMLLPRSIDKGMARYYAGKVRNVAWPYVVWMFVTCLILLRPEDLTKVWHWVGGAYHLWFLAVLMACYLVGPLTRFIPAWLWVLPMVLLSPIPSTNALGRILWYGAFFFAGAAATALVARWQARGPALPAIAAGLAIVYGVGVAMGDVPHGEESVLFFIPSMIGIAALLWFAPRAPRMPLLERAGRNSLVIYLVHFPAIGAVCLVLRELGSPWSSWTVAYPLLLLAGLLGPLALLPLRNSMLFTAPHVNARHVASARVP